MSETCPLVSIVIATYNRSNVLGYAVESVLRQSLVDWELIVIGDACTDNTGEVMQAFIERDPRVKYFNRSVNFGEQSGPNNDGAARSTGRYLAFLNHDDIWLEDHLEILVKAISGRGCDMVFSLVDYVQGEGTSHIVGATPSGKYEPLLFVPASSWLIDRSMVEDIGPWRAASELYSIPSQDWCFRAWKAGKKIEMVACLGVVAIPSGGRKNSYSQREFAINEEYYKRSLSPLEFRVEELSQAAGNDFHRHLRHIRSGLLFKWGLLNVLRQLLTLFGVHPGVLMNFWKYGKRGGFVAKLREVRGID